MVIRPAAAAVGEPVLGGRGQLRGGEPVAPVQVDHRPGQRRVRADDVGDLGEVDVDVEVAVHRHLAQFGDQPGVVLGGEERRVDAEDLGDPQQHRDGQRADVVLDLVQVARRDLQHLGQRRLAEPAFAAELPHPRADERFGHVNQRNNAAKAPSHCWHGSRLWQDRWMPWSTMAGRRHRSGEGDDAGARPAPRRLRHAVAAAGRRHRPRRAGCGSTPRPGTSRTSARTICANWASRRPIRCGSCAAP